MIRIKQDPDRFVGEIHEPGLLEEDVGVVAIGDGTAGLAGGGVEVVPEFAKGGGFVRWARGVVAARSPVDLDEFAEAAGGYVSFTFRVSSRNFPLLPFLEGMVRIRCGEKAYLNRRR